MSDKDSKIFDVVIFGATGYTGRYVIEELVNVIDKSNRDIKWAIAGRNKEKLKASLESVQRYVEKDIMNTDILEADVSDVDSIAEMCKKAKLILNCVGPYKLYGEIVVRNCVEYGTHHVDISGEMKYLEETQANYFHEAESKGIYIVQSCGFDSIPADCGLTLLKEKFPGDLNSVESYVEFIPGPEGAVTNVGTFASGVYTVSDVLLNSRSLWKLLKEKIFTKEMPKSGFPLGWRMPVYFSEVTKSWCLPFMGPDERVVERSQMFNYQFFDKRPVQFKPYLCIKSFIAALTISYFVGIFGFLSLFSFGRYLLVTYPSIFTLGMFSTKGPTRSQVEQTRTKMILCGKGWSEKLSDPLQRHTEKPNVKINLVINGPEPAYALTSRCMVNAGLVILEESDKMPLNGGVLTPGAAFEKTSLCKRLQDRGVTFEFQEN